MHLPNRSDAPASCKSPPGFETGNGEAYSLLLRIEVVLRELVREHWLTLHGDSWPKRLPADLSKTIRDAQREENRPYYGFQCLGPLYYLTFGQLLTLLNQAPCKALIDKLGGQPFLKQLDAISPMRNAICHSRPIPRIGLDHIRLAHNQLAQAVTPERINAFLEHPDVGIHPEDARRDLSDAIRLIGTAVKTLPETLSVSPTAELATRQYWWRADLAGFNTAAVEAVLAAVKRYNQLPRGIGSVSLRHTFARDCALTALINTAASELSEFSQ